MGGQEEDAIYFTLHTGFIFMVRNPTFSFFFDLGRVMGSLNPKKLGRRMADPKYKS